MGGFLLWAILRLLIPQVFSVTDRYNLLHDAFLLAETDRLLYDIPLEFTKYLKKEKESLPWTLFNDRFTNFLLVMDGNSETVKMLKEYVRILTADLYDEVVQSGKTNRYFKKWPTRFGNCKFTYQDLDFTSTIIDLACQSSNEKCLKSMNDELQLYLNGENTTTDLRLVLSIAIPYVGNSSVWNILLKRFTDPNVIPADRAKILEGLVSFTTNSEIIRTINIMMEDPDINSTWARKLFEGLGNNPAAVPLLWNYTKHNWETLLTRLEAQNNPTAGMSIFCEAFKTLNYLGDLVRFLKNVPQVSDYIMEGCIEDIQEAITWSEKYEETLQTWLRWNLP